MLAGEMENMYAPPTSNGQWGGLPSVPAQEPKSEQGAPEQEPGQGGQPEQQERGTANMSDQMLQILEKLKRGG